MFRTVMIASAVLLFASPAAAATYSAKAAAPSSGRFIARDITWTCSEGACQGATAESRPAVLCQSLAKQVGRIESFVDNGHEFSAEQLDKCNAAARDRGAPALAKVN